MFLMFLKEALMLTKAAFIWSKYSENSHIVLNIITI